MLVVHRVVAVCCCGCTLCQDLLVQVCAPPWLVGAGMHWPVEVVGTGLHIIAADQCGCGLCCSLLAWVCAPSQIVGAGACSIGRCALCCSWLVWVRTSVLVCAGWWGLLVQVTLLQRVVVVQGKAGEGKEEVEMVGGAGLCS